MESSSALGKSKLSPTRKAIAVAAKRNIAITTMVLGLYSFRPRWPVIDRQALQPVPQVPVARRQHLKPRIGIVKHPAAGYRVKFQQLGITAAFADQAGNPPLDFRRDRLADNGNIKLILLARVIKLASSRAGTTTWPARSRMSCLVRTTEGSRPVHRTSAMQVEVLSYEIGSEDRTRYYHWNRFKIHK